MDKTQAYMQNLKMEEVPWGRLDTAYGRAGDFPEYFKTIWAMAFHSVCNDISGTYF